uniref:response regulator n=1 Tax=Ignavibacterium sp. TaxID=2651167 RepID=UPI0025BA1017
MRVAIAEDNDYLAKSLIEKFSVFKEKFEIVHRAKNGKEIVDYVLNNPQPDVILMDIEMPELDGIKATE